MGPRTWVFPGINYLQKGMNMRNKVLLAVVMMAAAMASFAAGESQAGLPAPPGLPAPSVNVHVNGALPAPPGVNVHVEGGTPVSYSKKKHRGEHEGWENEGRGLKKGHHKHKKHGH